MTRVWFRASIFGKVFGLSFGVCAAIVIGVVLYFPHRQIASSSLALEVKTRTYASLLGEQVEPAIAFEDHVTAREVFDSTSLDPDVLAIALFTADGRLLEASGDYTSITAAPPPRGLRGPLFERDDTSVRCATPVLAREGPRGVIVVQLSTEAQKEEARRIRLASFVAGAAALLLALLASFMLARSLARRTRVLASEAAAVASGDFTRAPVVDRSTDEVGQLTSAFNHMVATLRALVDQVEIAARDEACRLEALVSLRTAELAARNRDLRVLLDNVAQGFVTIDAEGRMGPEQSATLEKWFGPLACAGEKLSDYLSRIDCSTGGHFEVAYQMLISELLPLDLALLELPSTLRSGVCHFRLHYAPIFGESGTLASLLVSITDVTDAVEHARADEGRRDTYNALERALTDRLVFAGFLSETETTVQSVATGALDRAEEIRAIHTLKGNSGLFGMNGFARFCHDLETRALEDGVTLTDADRQELSSRWTFATRGLRVILAMSPDRIDVSHEEHEALLADIASGVSRSALAERARSWRLEGFGSRLDRVAEQTRALAARLGKPDLIVKTSAGSERFAPMAWAPFWSAFVHVLRNAIDHGIEPAEERLAKGKSPAGTFELSVEREGERVVLTARDDGRGIDWEHVRAKALVAGLPSETTRELTDAIFADGISTAEWITETSGRGVGLAAVREACRPLRAEIEVTSVAGVSTTFRFVFNAEALAPTTAENVLRERVNVAA